VKKTLIVVATHRGETWQTTESIKRTGCESLLFLRGCPDQSKARSMAIDQGLEATEGTPIDTFLLLDDDMVFEPGPIQELVDHSRLHKDCCSAVAVGAAGQVCAKPLEQLVLLPGEPTRWLTGLACLAVPRVRLLWLRERLPNVGGITEWCRSGAHPDFPNQWLGNDFWFCHHFGGVRLLQVPVGHMKTVPLWPDARTLREVYNFGARRRRPGAESE
jgi:hypothetical protein